MATKDKKISIRPLDDRIVIQRLESEEKTAGGILLPDAAREKSQQAKVLAVGPGKLLDTGSRATLDVAVGDTVLVSKYGGTDVKVGGEEYSILRESDVLAIVK